MTSKTRKRCRHLWCLWRTDSKKMNFTSLGQPARQQIVPIMATLSLQSMCISQSLQQSLLGVYIFPAMKREWCVWP